MAKIIETATGAQALTFDDVLLQPGHSDVMPGETDVRTKIAGRKYLDDIIRMPFEYEGGCLRVPDGPGLGIEVDEEKLRRYALDA